MSKSPQILLPLEDRAIDRFDNFLAGLNARVVFALTELLQSPGGCLFISGPEGSGKTHLLNASCNQGTEQGLRCFYLNPGRQAEVAAKGLDGLEEMDLVCIDDVDHIAGIDTWEKALFHLFNRLRANQGRLVVSSRRSLSSIQFKLPDLASRLAWGLRLSLEPLDDDDKLQVLQIKAKEQGIDLSPEVASYLIRRGSRSMVGLLGNLEAVRIAALTRKRQISVPLTREVLEQQ